MHHGGIVGASWRCHVCTVEALCALSKDINMYIYNIQGAHDEGCGYRVHMYHKGCGYSTGCTPGIWIQGAYQGWVQTHTSGVGTDTHIYPVPTPLVCTLYPHPLSCVPCTHTPDVCRPVPTPRGVGAGCTSGVSFTSCG